MPAHAPTIVFRVDAGLDLGGGHAHRCLAAACEMRAAGWNCVFASRPETFSIVPAIAGEGFSRHEVISRPEVEPRALADAFANVDVLLVDHYERGADFEQACGAWAARVVAIDDRPNRPHAADMLIDPTVGRQAREYRGLVPLGCRLLCGPEYALQRPEFASLRAAALARRAEARVERVLVSVGATDPRDLTSWYLDALDMARIECRIDVVLGARATRAQAIAARAAASSGRIRLHLDTTEMAALMARADLALGAAGGSALERCCLGLPAIIAVVADNQADIARGLADAGAATVLAYGGKEASDGCATTIARLARNPTLLGSMSRAAARLSDGLGAKRVATALADLIGGDATVRHGRKGKRHRRKNIG